MARYTVQAIWSGIAASQYFASAGQSLATLGIDPDLPISDSVGDRLAAGALRPSGYATFSAPAIVSTAPYAIITTPKNTNIYALLMNGRLISYNSSFGSETLISAIPSCTSDGTFGVYYNNYIYVGTTTDISRYGPLSDTPALTNSIWTGSTLGSQTALTNTSYPRIRGTVGRLPNRPMFVHGDNKLYMGDFKNGQGLIHAIKTTKTTYEGDTNDGSAYNVLDLPFGYMPTCIGSLGNDLVIGAIQTTDGTIAQGKASLFFWDTFNDSFYLQVPVPDPMVTALVNNNGYLYVFSGTTSNGTDVSNGYRVSRYLGGQTLEQVFYSNSGMSPLIGAVDAVGEKVVWGTFEQLQSTTASSPEYYATVMSFASKDSRLPGGMQAIVNARAVTSSSEGVVTAVKNLQQSSFSFPKFVVGWSDASGGGLDRQSTTYGTAVWRSQMINVGEKSVIKRIHIPLAAAVGSNMTITPKVFVDDFTSSSTLGLTVINNTNFPNSERSVTYYPDIASNHNFCLEIRWTGSALLPVLLPITIDFDVFQE